MPSMLNAYLNFKDNTAEAMAFYQTIFGGEVTSMTFGQTMPSSDPVEDAKVMHSELRGANGFVFMASDTPSHMEYDPGTNFSMSLSGEDESELRGYFDKLAEGGMVGQPMEAAPWGDIFGMLTDKFGIQWLVNVNKQSAG